MSDLLTLTIRNAFVQSQRRKMTEEQALKIWEGWLERHNFRPLDEAPVPPPPGFAYAVEEDREGEMS